MKPPQTRYVDVAGTEVAYQVVGEGAVDVVYVTGAGHVDVWWDHERAATFLLGLASFGRLVMFDRRGIGASGPLPAGTAATWEEFAEDLLAVLDEVGSEQVVLFGELEGGPASMLFAALHPERVHALVLCYTSARLMADVDYPIGDPHGSNIKRSSEATARWWGTESLARVYMPSLADDPTFLAWHARLMRAATTPRQAGEYFQYIMSSVDVRSALPTIGVPTLVLHRRTMRAIPAVHTEYIAARIDGAVSRDVPGGDSLSYGEDRDVVLDEISEFLTGERRVADVDRVLTTILFTDIVASTSRAAEVGDRRWRALLDDHDRLVRAELRRFRGREIKTTGDGFVAAFDGPARAIRCASAITGAVRGVGLEVRTGLHTGECEVRGDDLGGLAVHIAARVGALAGTGEVLVSRTVKDLVAGSGIQFADRGIHTLKGVPEEWALYEVQSLGGPT